MSDPDEVGRWFPTLSAAENPLLRLVCLAAAGAGTAAFAGWSRRLPEWVHVVPVRLPGRESRVREPAHGDLDGLVAALASVLPAVTTVPYVLVGHCSGALTLFEAARSVARDGTPGPLALWAVAQAAPRVAGVAGEATGAPAPDVWDRLRQTTELPESLAHDAAFRAFVGPSVEADFALVDSYRYREGASLSVPIDVWLGRRDPVLSRADVLAWGLETDDAFTVHPYDGDHRLPATDHGFYRQLATAAEAVARGTPET